MTLRCGPYVGLTNLACASFSCMTGAGALISVSLSTSCCSLGLRPPLLRLVGAGAAPTAPDTAKSTTSTNTLIDTCEILLSTINSDNLLATTLRASTARCHWSEKDHFHSLAFH